jgi:hypothetical protein
MMYLFLIMGLIDRRIHMDDVCSMHFSNILLSNLLTPHRKRMLAETMVFTQWKSLKLLIPMQNGLPRMDCPAAWYVVIELSGFDMTTYELCQCSFLFYYYLSS